MNIISRPPETISLPITQSNKTPQKKTPSNCQSAARSVTKFKRTNPSLQNTKPTSPFPKKQQNNQLANSRINYVKSDQLSNENDRNYQMQFATNLTTSRQTPRTEQMKNVLYLSRSKEHTILLTERNSVTREKFNPQQEDLRSIKSFKSGRSSNKGSKAQNQNYSLYWKKKAHEYLQNNFKLTQEVSDLKKQLEKYQVTLPLQGSVTNSQLGFSSSQSQSQTEKSIPVYIVEMQQKKYFQQITQLEITNRLKDSVIENMQNKIIQLTDKIKGQQEKSQLMQKMRRQITELEQKNKKIVELEQKNKKMAREQEQTIKLNKVYQTQKALQQVKQKSKPSVQIAFPQLPDYKFEKDLEKHRYRSLQ